MDFFLQFGHGMMSLSEELLTSWRGGGVVLSPRDLTETQLINVAKTTSAAGGDALLDPQCYVKHADKKKLVNQAYWKAIKRHSTGAFTGGPGTDALLRMLAELARRVGTRVHILPGCLADEASDDWLATQAAIIEAAPAHFGDDPLLATIALSAKACSDEEQVEAVIEAAASWDVSGYYVVAEVPDQYLVDSPVWLGNLLILVAGLKLIGKTVVIGYGNHQSLCLRAAKADFLCSGTWLNVRAFNTERFLEPEEGSVSRRTRWYYCAQALSEYKLPFLDLALNAGELKALRTRTPFSGALFSGAAPTTVDWPEANAFRHYLTALRQQAIAPTESTFEDCLSSLHRDLDQAETLLRRLARVGVRGQDRDFAPCIDVARGALAKYRQAYGARMRRAW